MCDLKLAAFATSVASPIEVAKFRHSVDDLSQVAQSAPQCLAASCAFGIEIKYCLRFLQQLKDLVA